MQGFQVLRKAGWDTHGLPVELGVEKTLGITKEDIGKKISVDEYNASCRREVMKYTQEWETLTNKMGYWVDMKDPYITYDNRYIETVWWLLAQLYKKNLPRCQGHHMHRAVHRHRPAARDAGLGNSRLPRVDDYPLDPSVEHRPRRRPHDPLLHPTHIQPIQRRPCNRHCRRSADKLHLQ